MLSLRGLAGALFGGACALCRGAARGPLCAACEADLPRAAAERCPRCALPAPGASLCGRCLAQSPAYDATIAALEYRFPADVLVRELKFAGRLALGALAGELLARAVVAAGEPRPDCVVPVPLGRARLAARGFNQATLIARAAARALAVPMRPALCERARETAVQSELPLEKRAANVRDAFVCPALVGGLAIAVVDDVMTSGATLEAVARALKAAGAARVVNWVLARTPPPA
ncbi:MAG: double zinc ribbon domain-containing protein [Burkholderiales bacterium]|nr:double zinc ribbon domain-containing protein [Burkholderiales bacterium]